MLFTSKTLLGPNPRSSAYLQGYRMLRSAVLAVNDKQPFETVLVTSPGEREGKTTVSINLGTILSLMEKSAIVVDADFYGGGIGAALGIPESTLGLTDLCLGQAQLEEVLIATEIPLLHIVASGTQMDRGPELVGGGAMKQVVTDLKEQAEFIVFDCTSVSGFGAPLTLAGLVDSVFMVALARSQATDVQRCLDALEEVGANIAGVILNDVLPQDSTVYRAYNRYYA